MAIVAEKSVVELEHALGGVHAVLAADSTQFFKGMMVYVNAAGRLTPMVGSAGATFAAAGVCQETFLTGASNTRKIVFNSGVFKFINGASGIAQDDLNKFVYATDNETVAVTVGTNATAGSVYQVDTDGVFVLIQWPRTTAPAQIAAT